MLAVPILGAASTVMLSAKGTNREKAAFLRSQQKNPGGF